MAQTYLKAKRYCWTMGHHSVSALLLPSCAHYITQSSPNISTMIMPRLNPNDGCSQDLFDRFEVGLLPVLDICRVMGTKWYPKFTQSLFDEWHPWHDPSHVWYVQSQPSWIDSHGLLTTWFLENCENKSWQYFVWRPCRSLRLSLHLSLLVVWLMVCLKPWWHLKNRWVMLPPLTTRRLLWVMMRWLLQVHHWFA